MHTKERQTYDKIYEQDEQINKMAANWIRTAEMEYKFGMKWHRFKFIIFFFLFFIYFEDMICFII